MKAKEELNALKEEVKVLSKKLAELTEDELTEVTGGLASFDAKKTSRFLVQQGKVFLGYGWLDQGEPDESKGNHQNEE